MFVSLFYVIDKNIGSGKHTFVPRGSRCEWVLGFSRTVVMRAGSNMGPPYPTASKVGPGDFTQSPSVVIF